MCTCMQNLEIYFFWICVIKYSKIWFIEIFYEAIMHKMEFDQAHSIILLKRIPKNFFVNSLQIYMNFGSSLHIWIGLNEIQNEKGFKPVVGCIWPTSLNTAGRDPLGFSPRPQLAWWPRPRLMTRTRRMWSPHGGYRWWRGDWWQRRGSGGE
jgi:hypothetical protein